MTSKARREPMIRPSAVAGSWYPGTERGLRADLEGYLAAADEQPLPGRLVGLISPHAGYTYSGPTAAHAYKQLEGRSFDRVVVMSPNHRAMWRGDFVVTQATHYQTPLGLVELDQPFLDRLGERVSITGVTADTEHALEIQLPFLQVVLQDFRLVPIMINANRAGAAQTLGAVLGDLVAGDAASTLLVASTDLHHISDYEEVEQRDRQVVDALVTYDLDRIRDVLMAPDCSVCGRMAILALLRAGQALGADQVRVLHHTTSADVTGMHRRGQYTVGYLAAAVVATNT